MKNRLGLIFALVLLGSFFAPWSKFFALPGSGFHLALDPKIEGMVLFVLPVLCLIVIATSVMMKFNNWWLQAITGLVPIVGSIVGLFIAADKMDITVGDLLPNVPPFLDWGLYLTLASGCLLFISGLMARKRP